MATQWINIKANEWTKVNNGAGVIQKSAPWQVKVFIGTNDPDDTSPYGLWDYGELKYNGSDSVYIKSKKDLKVTVFT